MSLGSVAATRLNACPLMLHIALTSLHISPLGRIVQEKFAMSMFLKVEN